MRAGEDSRTPIDGPTAPNDQPDSVGDLGLSIDMLDVDRLRDWARLIDENGPDISYWGDRYYVATKMRMMASAIEQAVRDVGALRAMHAGTTS